MNTYVQFKDGVAFAYVITDSEIESLTRLDGSINPDSVMGKTLENGAWVVAPKIRYISELNEQRNRILAIEETVYSSEVDGEIVSSDVKRQHVRHGDVWADEEHMKQQTNPGGHVSWVWNPVDLVWTEPEQTS